jgi:hypothetical protein
MAVLASGATTARSLAAMAGDVENFYSYGGINGATDNTAAVNATIAASIASGKSAWFPPNQINTQGNHLLPAGIAPILATGTGFNGNGSANDCFVFEAGSHNVGHIIGGIRSFLGSGIRLQDCAFVGVNVGNIGGCGVGVCFNAVDGGVLDNNVNFQTIYSSQIAIEYLSNLSNGTFQGNVVKGNFINGCGKAGYFNLASTDNSCDLNYFWIAAIDGLNGVSIGTNGSGFSYASGGGEPSQITVKVPGFFGNITGPAFMLGNNCLAEFSLQGTFQGSQFQSYVVGSVYKNIYARSNGTSQVSAITEINLSLFNGGVPLFTMEQEISLPVPAMTAGQIEYFYVFHAFAVGYTQMYSLSPKFSQALVITDCEDVSLTDGLYCVRIGVAAITSITAGNQIASLRYAGG